MHRKEFIARGGRALCAIALSNMTLVSCKNGLFSKSKEYYIKPARHWKKLHAKTVRCNLCPNECELDNGDTGVCRVRRNIDGALFTLNYSRIAAMHVDPIEKKPLYHFHPGETALSIATAGCNLSCRFCQNWQLSQANPDDIEAKEITPVNLARMTKKGRSRIIAYTYNEPTVQFEYIIDSSRVARNNGIKSVMISNGYISPAAGRELARSLDGIKIDLKAFSETFYRDICGGSLKSVLKNLEAVYSEGKWLEIVVLVIPGLNDSSSEIKKMSAWIVKNLSPDVPLHFTRFHSTYKIRNLPPTPVSTLEQCRTIAKDRGIRYPYVGNVPGHKWENTCCHNCGKIIIRRAGYYNIDNTLVKGRCKYCGTRVPGVWS